MGLDDWDNRPMQTATAGGVIRPDATVREVLRQRDDATRIIDIIRMIGVRSCNQANPN